MEKFGRCLFHSYSGTGTGDWSSRPKINNNEGEEEEYKA